MGACFAFAAAAIGGGGAALIGACGPFTDVTDAAFCPFVLEIFYLGITTGTTATTYDPTASVSRLQMAAFLSRTVDGVLKRGGRRAALGQFWTTQGASVLGITTIGGGELTFARSDGADVWVTNHVSQTVSRVRASDGRLLETWTGVVGATGVLLAMGKVFVTANENAPFLYGLDPTQPAGFGTTVASSVWPFGVGIAFDGARIWVSSQFGNTAGAVSIVTPGATLPWTVTTVTTGFFNLAGALYDGANVWVSEYGNGLLFKLAANGTILQTVTVGPAPLFPVFDGANIWVPNSGSDSVSVIRASTGALLKTLTGNGLGFPEVAAFDGQRVLVTNVGGNSVSLWKAADLTEIGTFSTGAATAPFGACSDGVNFWIVLSGPGRLARF